MNTPNFFILLIVTINSANSFNVEVKTSVIVNHDEKNNSLSGENVKIVIDAPELYINGTPYQNDSSENQINLNLVVGNRKEHDDVITNPTPAVKNETENDNGIFQEDPLSAIKGPIEKFKKWVNDLSMTKIKKSVNNKWENIRQSLKKFIEREKNSEESQSINESNEYPIHDAFEQSFEKQINAIIKKVEQEKQRESLKDSQDKDNVDQSIHLKYKPMKGKLLKLLALIGNKNPIYSKNVSSFDEEYLSERNWSYSNEESYEQDINKLTENLNDSNSTRPTLNKDNKMSSELVLENVYQTVSKSSESDSSDKERENNAKKSKKPHKDIKQVGSKFHNNLSKDKRGNHSMLENKLNEKLAKAPKISNSYSKIKPFTQIANLLNINTSTEEKTIENKTSDFLVTEMVNNSFEKNTKTRRNVLIPNRRFSSVVNSSTTGSQNIDKKNIALNDNDYHPGSKYQMVLQNSKEYGPNDSSNFYSSAGSNSKENIEFQKFNSSPFDINQGADEINKNNFEPHGVESLNETYDRVVEFIKKLQNSQFLNNDGFVEGVKNPRPTSNMNFKKSVSDGTFHLTPNKNQFKQNEDDLNKLDRDMKSILIFLNTQQGNNIKMPYEPKNTSRITNATDNKTEKIKCIVKDPNQNEGNKCNVTNTLVLCDKLMKPVNEHINPKKGFDLIEKDSDLIEKDSDLIDKDFDLIEVHNTISKKIYKINKSHDDKHISEFSKILEKIYKTLVKDRIQKNKYYNEQLEVLKQITSNVNKNKWNVSSLLNVMFVINNDEIKYLSELENNKNKQGKIDFINRIKNIVKKTIAALESSHKKSIFDELSDQSNKNSTEPSKTNENETLSTTEKEETTNANVDDSAISLDSLDYKNMIPMMEKVIESQKPNISDIENDSENELDDSKILLKEEVELITEKEETTNSNVDDSATSLDSLGFDENMIPIMEKVIESQKPNISEIENDSENELDDSKILLKKEVKDVVSELHSNENATENEETSKEREMVDSFKKAILNRTNASASDSWELAVIYSKEPLDELNSNELSTITTLQDADQATTTEIVSTTDIFQNGDSNITNQLDSDLDIESTTLHHNATNNNLHQSGEDNQSESDFDASEIITEKHNAQNPHDIDPDDYIFKYLGISNSSELDSDSSYLNNDESDSVNSKDVNAIKKNDRSDKDIQSSPINKDIDLKVDSRVSSTENSGHTKNNAEIISKDHRNKLKRSIKNLTNKVYPSIDKAAAIKRYITQKVKKDRVHLNLRKKPKYEPGKVHKDIVKIPYSKELKHGALIKRNEYISCDVNEIRINGLCVKAQQGNMLSKNYDFRKRRL